MTDSSAMASVRVDNWVLRCRFNHARIHALAIAAKVHAEYEDEKPADPKLGLPPDTMTQMVFYFTDSMKTCEIARAHWVLLPGWEPDPKRLYIDGVTYRQMKGTPQQNRDTELIFPDGWQRRGYKRLRKLACRMLGPDADQALSASVLKRMGWPYA